jgi:hypothetical protein
VTVELMLDTGAPVRLDFARCDRQRGVWTGRLDSGGDGLVPIERVRRERIVRDRFGFVGGRPARVGGA